MRICPGPLSFLLSACVSMALSGCGPTYTRTVMLDDELLDPAKDGIVIGSIEFGSGASGESVNRPDNANRNDVTLDELYSAYHEELQRSLDTLGISFDEGENQYVTNITILGYKEGNAFLRWLTPAGGESKVVIQASIERDGELVGGVESQQTIAWGGGFSIGGWKHVINWSAHGLASELCKEMFRFESGHQSSCAVTSPSS